MAEVLQPWWLTSLLFFIAVLSYTNLYLRGYFSLCKSNIIIFQNFIFIFVSFDVHSSRSVYEKPVYRVCNLTNDKHDGGRKKIFPYDYHRRHRYSNKIILIRLLIGPNHLFRIVFQHYMMNLRLLVFVTCYRRFYWTPCLSFFLSRQMFWYEQKTPKVVGKKPQMFTR